MNSLIGRDILDGAQFNRKEIDLIMQVASDMQKKLERKKKLDLLEGYLMGSLFFEPSTRTRLSFETAMYRLGGGVVGFSEAGSTSSKKGESLEDTIRTVDQYADLIVMRHPQIGAANQAADAANAVIINGGDGAGQHPTQALLDLFSIQTECNGVDGKTIVLCGDLKNGRTVHAGVELYKHFDCKLVFVAPEQLLMPEAITNKLRAFGVTIEETTELEPALAKADVFYMTRIQKERFDDPQLYEKLKGKYILKRELVERVNPNAIILHPLPRVNEIDSDMDALSNAAYFRQVRNGVFTRMALIALVMDRI
ncbi:MAG: aspartate carbamoyltransferase [Anaerolineales bacterium]|nr:aspartate carbamoyltransferase [Anaerolineales bacterium]